MKIEEVPQDPRMFRQGDQLKKLVYATRSDGQYTGVRSAGWEVENFATRTAWEQVEARMTEVVRQLSQGSRSPIAYFMERSLMDVPLLAKYMGKWTWQVRRHLNPRVFSRLSSRTLEAYAQVFNISLDRLTRFDLQKEEEERKNPHLNAS